MAESDPQIDLGAGLQDRPRRRSGRLGRIALFASVPLLLLIGILAYFFLGSNYATTDNAYVHQDKVSISAQVTGDIVAAAVRENQLVKPGDLLFQIDPAPFRIAVAQADAAIAAARVNVIGLQTDLSATGADIAGAEAGVRFYTAEYQRQAALMAQGFTTRAHLQQAEHDLSDARNKLADMQGAAAKARAAMATGATAGGGSALDANPGVLAAQAQKRKAELDLSRSIARAPVGGKISQASRLQVGQYMIAGLPALTIVDTDHSWIEANFKETDLAHMRLGQPATLTFDAYPGMKLRGHVASIGAGTGSEFSLLPAENATGNWIKVTQRVPVRIAVDDHPSRPLIAGLSTHVSVDVSQ